jgi:AraC-like DNA-binding protein
VYNLGLALLLATRSGDARYRRPAAAARRDDLDHFLIHIPVSGGVNFMGSNRVQRIGRLDTATADLARPLDIAVRAGCGVTLILPRARLVPLIGERALHGRRVARASAAGALLGRHLVTLSRQAARLQVAEALAYADVTARLVAACLAVAAPEQGASAAVPARPGLAQKLRSHIETHLDQPRLDAAALAEAFHLSRSQLYRLFEPMGGVHRYIRGRRLHRALELFSRPDSAPRRIGDVAYSLGFANEAHFSRLFHDRFGLSPRAVRQAAAQGRASWLGGDPPAGEASPLARWLRELTLA